MEHWKAIKKVLRYIQGTKDHMLTYRRSNHLNVIGYSDSNFVGCVDTRKSILGNTKWRVNRRVLGVVESIWAGGGNIAGLVDCKDVSINKKKHN